MYLVLKAVLIMNFINYSLTCIREYKDTVLVMSTV